MSESDRHHDEPNADAALPVEDLSLATVDARSADQIKGGVEVTKTTDTSSATLFHELVHATK